MPALAETPVLTSKITVGTYVQIEVELAPQGHSARHPARACKIELLPWRVSMSMPELIRELAVAARASREPLLAALQAAIDPAHAAAFQPAAVERLLRWPASRRRVQIWQVLLRVPFGQTVSYGELARRVSPPSAPRAVGQTMNQNPFPLIVPCHRVIQANGGMGGFGSGLSWKSALLAWEKQG